MLGWLWEYTQMIKFPYNSVFRQTWTPPLFYPSVALSYVTFTLIAITYEVWWIEWLIEVFSSNSFNEQQTFRWKWIL